MKRSEFQRTIFCSVAAQHDNLGDIEIRRNALRWFVESGAPIVIYTGKMPAEYIGAFDLDGDVRLISSALRYQTVLVARVLTRSASIAFAPGPQVFSNASRSLAKSLVNMVNVRLVRLSGGRAIAVGRSLRGSGNLALRIQRRTVKLFDVYAVRDDRSSDVIGLPLEESPDLAFDHNVTGAPWHDRKVVVFSFRSDRNINIDSLRAAVSSLQMDGYRVVFATQVLRDEAQHSSLASAVGAETYLWGDKTHKEQLEGLAQLYADARVVVSNRLHALLLGVQSGAVPIAATDEGSDKLSSTLKPWLDYRSLPTSDLSSAADEALRISQPEYETFLTSRNFAKRRLDELKEKVLKVLAL